jgi:NADH-quinone oxidoreductase subunit M
MITPPLSTMIFLPLLAGLVVLVLPLGRESARAVGLAVAVLMAAFSINLFALFDPISGGFAFYESYPLVPALGIGYRLGVDGLSLLLLVAAGALFPVVYLLFSTKSRGYYGCLLIVQSTMIGAICAADLVLFYFFYELMLLPIFFMIGLYGGPNRVGATLKITIYTIAGSLLMLASCVYLGVVYQAQSGVWSFAVADLTTLRLSGTVATVALLGFVLAFAVKIPLFPLHTWLPDAYTEAPPAATFVLSAIMAKIGAYGVLRFVLPIFPEPLGKISLLLAFLAVVGMAYCGIAALGQRDMKRLLAFCSASHMGIIGVGLFCLNVQAITGVLYQMVAHATSVGLLFLLAGLIEERTSSRDVDSFGGLGGQAPLFSVFFMVALLGSVGLPGTASFIGEFLIIVGAVKFNLVIGILAGTSMIIAVTYMLWLFGRVFFGPRTKTATTMRDLTPIESLTVLPLIVLIVVMGLFSGTLYRQNRTSRRHPERPGEPIIGGGGGDTGAAGGW